MENKVNQYDKVSYSERTSDRFIELCENGEILYSDEVKILTYLANKYDPATVSEYSREIGKHYKVVKDRINRDKIATQEIGNTIFVLKKLN